MFENMNIKMIMAVTKDGVLGTETGKLPWKCSEDMRFFRNMTANKIILMGGNTFRSLPEVLKGRKATIILSNTLKIEDIDNPDFEHIKIVPDLESASEYIKDIVNHNLSPEERKEPVEVMVIGGLQIYEQMYPYCKGVYISHIDEEYYGYGDLGEYLPEYGKYIFADKLIEKFRNDMVFFEVNHSYNIDVTYGDKYCAPPILDDVHQNAWDRLHNLIDDNPLRIIRKKDMSDEESFELLKSMIKTRSIEIYLDHTNKKNLSNKGIWKRIYNNTLHNIRTYDTGFFRFETLLYGFNVVLIDGTRTVSLIDILERHTNDVVLHTDLSKMLFSGRYDLFRVKELSDNND